MAATKKKKKSSIRIRPEHCKELERLIFLQQYHEQLKQVAGGQVSQLLQVGYGVDLAHENWQLDLSRGVLLRMEEEEEAPTNGAGDQ